MTAAVFLITLGVLFLLDQNWIIAFDKSWPILLLVTGGMIFFCRTAPTENHIEPYRSSAMNVVTPQPPAAWNPPPPPPPAASSAQANPEVKP